MSSLIFSLFPGANNIDKLLTSQASKRRGPQYAPLLAPFIACKAWYVFPVYKTTTKSPSDSHQVLEES